MNFEHIYNETFGTVKVDFPFIMSLLEKYRPQSILELGAGGGRCLPLYKEANISKIFLNDISVENIRLLEKRIADMSLDNCILLNSPSYKLDHIDDQIDMVLIPFAGISEMSPLLFTLSEVHQILSENGILYFNAINPKSKITGAYGLKRTSLMKWNHSVSAETIKTGAPENFEHHVHFEVRTPNKHNKTIIEQVHPDFSLWSRLLSISGFEILGVTGNFDGKDFSPQSDLIQVVAKKIRKKDPDIVSSKIIKELYNEISVKYDEIAKGPHYKIPNWLKQKIKPYESLNPIIMDFGCATGNVGEIVKELNINPCFLFGTDISTRMLDKAREKNIYTSLIQMDLSSGLPEPKSNLFDIVLALGFIEFLDNPILLLKDIHRVLKLGGEAFITFEKCQDDVGQTEMHIKDSKIIRKSYTRKQVQQLLDTANLESIALEDGDAYQSPSTGKIVNYWYCHTRKTSI